MVKRNIEQDIRNKNYGARNGNYERNAVVKNQGTKQRVQKFSEIVGQWESNRQCSRGDNCILKCRSGGNESSTRRPLPPRKTDRLPDLRIFSGHSSWLIQWMIQRLRHL